jgi:hypothetical protein
MKIRIEGTQKETDSFMQLGHASELFKGFVKPKSISKFYPNLVPEERKKRIDKASEVSGGMYEYPDFQVGRVYIEAEIE